MRKHIVWVLLLAALAVGQKKDSPEALLKAASYKAFVDGDLEGAIAQYKKIVAAYAANRAVAAAALVEMGRCYEKLGDAEARKAYRRVVEEYAEQAEWAKEARSRLAALGRAGGRRSGAGPTIHQVWAGPDVDDTGDLSPDGRYLTFTDWTTGDLAVRDLTTGEVRRLTNKGTWAQSDEYAEMSVVSPDGRQVAYGWYNKDTLWELRILPLNGAPDRSAPRILYRNEREYVAPSDWSPDGKTILAWLDRKDHTPQIALISVADGVATILKSGSVPKASFSPDGRYVAYDLREDRDIYVISVDGRQEAQLVRHPALDSHPVWAPDGNRVLFASDRAGSLGLWAVPVAEGKPQGPPELLKPDIGRMYPLGFTRDGTFYYSLSAGTQDILIAEFDPATGRAVGDPAPVAERFVGSNVAPVWSPDGQYLAYQSRRGPLPFDAAGLTIVVRSVKTGEERDVILKRKLKLGEPNRVGSLRWFPDGRSLLVSVSDQMQRWSFYRVEIDTGETTLIRQGAAGGPPRTVLSPDGKKIFFRRGDGEEEKRAIQVYDIDTGSAREVYRVNDPVVIGSFCLSRDGQWLAVLLSDPAKRSAALQFVPSGGGPAREVYRFASHEEVMLYVAPEWTPDGRYVLFVRPADPSWKRLEFWRVPVEGGKPEKIGLAMEQLNHPSFHPDGRNLAFTGMKPRQEVWAMQNFLPRVR